MKGWPAWPARVSVNVCRNCCQVEETPVDVKMPKGKAQVFFFGTHQTAFIAEKDLHDFHLHREKFSKAKSTGFKAALEEAESNSDVPVPLPTKEAETIDLSGSESSTPAPKKPTRKRAAPAKPQPAPNPKRRTRSRPPPKSNNLISDSSSLSSLSDVATSPKESAALSCSKPVKDAEENGVSAEEEEKEKPPSEHVEENNNESDQKEEEEEENNDESDQKEEEEEENNNKSDQKDEEEEPKKEEKEEKDGGDSDSSDSLKITKRRGRRWKRKRSHDSSDEDELQLLEEPTTDKYHDAVVEQVEEKVDPLTFLASKCKALKSALVRGAEDFDQACAVMQQVQALAE
ncbi:cyclic nucleotide gated channel beta 1, partial [Cichlidogyrus casuarinus]